MKKAIGNGRGGPTCPPVRRADTQVGPYKRPAIKKRPRRLKSVGLVAIVVAFTLCGAVARAQQAKKVPRIGYLSVSDAAIESTRAEGIRLALRERGHIEGQNITTEYRYAEGKPDRYPELLAELLRLKVDIIVVAGGTGVIRATKNATKTIPIVMFDAGANPVEDGLVESLAHPGATSLALQTLL